MKVIKQLAYAVSLLIAFASCGGDSGGSSGMPAAPTTPTTPTSTAVTGVSISKTTLTLVEGTSETVTATVTPSTAVNKNVTWSSSDSNIATVDNEGKITAKKPGTVKITVTTVDGNKTATLTLTVDLDYIVRQKAVLKKIYDSLGGSSWTNKTGWNTEAELKDWYGITMNGNKISSINLKSNNLKGKIPASLGETLAVTRALSEADTRAEENDANTRGANDEEATTRAEENLSIMGGLKELDMSGNQISGSIPSEIGNLTTLTYINLSNNSISGSIPTAVGNLTNLTNLDLSDNNISGSIPPEVGNLTNLTNLDLGDNNISGSIPPEVGNLTKLSNLDLGGNNLTGSVPDELGKLDKLENLDISDNKLSGEISTDLQESDMWKNLKEEPELKQQGGIELEKEVEITKPVTGVSIDKTTLELTVGETATLTATVAPADASKKTVTWSSSDSNVATIDNGVVKAIAPGRATITVTTKDGGKTATCAVTVKTATVAVTGVSLNKTSLELTVGGSETLTATIAPSDATNKDVTWSSSNTSVAAIDANGKVTAVITGNATITVMTTDGGKNATCTVTVKAATVAVTGVTLNKSSLELTIGDTEALTATVTPENATDKSVTWSSNNTSVATVDANGKVTAVAAGNATITVTTKDGSKTATCTVTVKAAAPATIAVIGVSLNKSSLELTVGATESLSATVAPSDATDKNVSWSSNNTSVATVDANGKVTAVAAGNATITVTTKDGNKTATCSVTVKATSVDGGIEGFGEENQGWGN